jgi:hypothetical protein
LFCWVDKRLTFDLNLREAWVFRAHSVMEELAEGNATHFPIKTPEEALLTGDPFCHYKV